MMSWLQDWRAALPLDHLSLWTLFNWGGLLFALTFIPTVLVQRRDRPMAALAWILCLVQLPFLGVLLWWVFGITHLKRRRRMRRAAIARIDAQLIALRDTMESEQHEGSLLPELFDSSSGVFPPSQGNTVTLFDDGEEAYDAFEAAIRGAQHHIHFEFYIWESDATGRRFRDLLAERAASGVEVRALYDGIGGAAVHGRFMRPLIAAGGKAAPFLPVNLFERRLRINFRNHRKIIIIDGTIAFTGGINIADEYRTWRDTAYRIEGPAVHQLQEVFAEDWFFATSEELATERYFTPALREARAEQVARGTIARVLASGPDTPEQPIHKAFFIALTLARERIWIITPYFIPDQALLVALQTAAMRGLDVRVVVPSRYSTDVSLTYWGGRTFYEPLIESGVRIFEYAEGILHAKNMIVDQSWSMVGSANFDQRSFRLNFETNCAFEDAALNDRLAQFALDTQAASREVMADRFAARSYGARMLEGVARLFSPLL